MLAVVSNKEILYLFKTERMGTMNLIWSKKFLGASGSRIVFTKNPDQDGAIQKKPLNQSSCSN